jgi:hypothetical protein
MLYVLGCCLNVGELGELGEFHSSTVAPERLFGHRIANRFDPENRRKIDNSRTTRPPFVYEYGYFPHFGSTRDHSSLIARSARKRSSVWEQPDLLKLYLSMRTMCDELAYVKSTSSPEHIFVVCCYP